MDEKAPQLNQERNIALERPAMVKEHNELHSKWETLDSFDKNLAMQGRGDQENIDIYNRKNELYGNVINIDRYRELAKSNENIETYKVGDISGIEKIKTEKHKIDNEINKIKEDVEKTSQKLNLLRAKLDLPPTDEIPSLMDKKIKLENLITIQNNLESQLKFAEQKNNTEHQINIENKNTEQKFLRNELQGLSFNLREMVQDQDSFGFKIIASSLDDFSDIDDLKLKLSKIPISVEDFAKNGLRDNLDSLREDAMKLNQIEVSLRNLPAKINDEVERKEFGQFVSNIANKVGEISSFIKIKANKLQDYLNVK